MFKLMLLLKESGDSVMLQRQYTAVKGVQQIKAVSTRKYIYNHTVHNAYRELN